jgi:micrococcal nuclease
MIARLFSLLSASAIALFVSHLPSNLRAETVTVLKVIDGDTLIIGERCSRLLDQSKLLRIRVFGIDTPESSKAVAKCDAEVTKGKAATEFARKLIKPGAQVTVSGVIQDKYACRVVGNVKLADGRSFADAMIKAGHARPYGVTNKKGALTKSSWCD